MDLSNFWWSGAGGGPGPGPDPGDPIGQSLRFRGAQRLNKDDFTQLHSRNSTISYWIKRGRLGTQQTIGLMDGGGNNGFGEFLADDTLRTYTQTGSITITNQVFRDPSAWIHIHMNQTTLWVNGEIALSGNLIDPTSGHDKFNIGVYGTNNIRYLDGHLAEFHFIDGQALDPTTFGRTNANGVWVPVDPKFDVDTTTVYSVDVTSSSGSWYASHTPDKMFDGKTGQAGVSAGGFTQTSGTGDTLTWAPSTSIPFTDKVEINLYALGVQNTFNVTVDGVTTQVLITPTGSNDVWYALASGGGNFEGYDCIGYYGGTAMGIRVDGKILVDGANPNYGPNGFHLTFADPLDVGKDYSGNGNDFTATGFDLQPYVNWISGLTTDDPGGFSASYPAKNAFDGNTATYAATTTNGNNTLFTPPTPISYTTSLKVFCCVYPGQEFKINGVAVTPTSTGCGWFIDESGPGTLTTFEIGPVASPAGQGAFLHAIEVDGVILVDSPNYFGYDLVQDSPTNNFATLNPILSPNNQTLTNANLAGSGGTGETSLATQVPTHKYYWEGYGSNYYHGLTAWDSVRTSYLGATVDQVGLFNDGSIYVSGGVQAYGPWFGATNIVMQAYDPSTGEYWAGRDGVWHNGSDPAAGTGALYTVDAKYREKMAPANNVAGSGFICPHNYGQQPFRYTPPAGFEPLSTTKMPAAPIANGRDHFQAITGPGAGGFKMYPEGTASTPGTGKTTEPLDTGGVYTYTPTTFGYVTPSYVLDAFLEQSSITFINNPGWYANGPIRLYTSADGINWTREADIPNLPETSLTFTATSPARYWRFNWDDDPNGYKNFGNITSTNAPILELAQTAFPSGLWWIKDRSADNNFYMVDSTNGTSSALSFKNVDSSPSRTAYVAPTDDAVAWCWDASDPAKTGFSITTGTHGLGAAPDLVIDSAGFLWHNSLPTSTTNSYKINQAFPPAGASSNWVISDTTVSSSQAGTYYSWRMIPGYSATGTYRPNDNADGPFVHCGFRPAFVWFFFIGPISSDDHYIWDTTRDVNNPAQAYFRYGNHRSTIEQTGTSTNGTIDILSNGFKLRCSAHPNYNAGNNLFFVWVAFAENPFQAPVTAR